MDKPDDELRRVAKYLYEEVDWELVAKKMAANAAKPAATAAERAAIAAEVDAYIRLLERQEDGNGSHGNTDYPR
jgi:hypothetical protein